MTRQHSKVMVVKRSPLRKIGRRNTVEVFENQLDQAVASGKTLTVRRIDVRLFKLRRDDATVVLMTNLPVDAFDGVRVSNLYRDRWKIGAACLLLTNILSGEMKTRCSPFAAPKNLRPPS